MIVYLHGFRSSPASHKARQLSAYMTQRGLSGQFWCEQLPVAPNAAVACAESAIGRCTVPPTLVGSSLGGFYATWLAEKHGLRAVLINPVVLAQFSLADFVGPQTNLYTGETFEFLPRHVAELAALEVAAPTRLQRYWLLVETGDELLDYRHAVAKYVGARQTVIEGGDHGFQHFGDYLDAILSFAGLARP